MHLVYYQHHQLALEWKTRFAIEWPVRLAIKWFHDTNPNKRLKRDSGKNFLK